jgi:prophage tail gpP-like protein
MSEDGQIVLTVNDRQLQGWTEERVTLGIERCPNDFDLTLTAVDPLDLGPDVAKPGDSFTLSIGDDLAATGYVNRLITRKTRDDHQITVIGRGKCQDLVDCSAEWAGGQIVNATAFQIAEKLASAYGIAVKTTAPAGPVVPQFNLTLGTTAWQIIETVCRWANVLAYEQADGSLLLASAGGEAHASGFSAGVNLLDWSVEDADDHCFSEYDAFRLAMDLLADLGTGGNLIGSATDPNVLRHRKQFIVAEAGAAGQDIAKKRALWEAQRNRGRASMVSVTADSWRDRAGKLWTPNHQAPVSIPGRYDGTLLTIAEVSFIRNDRDGTVAKLLLMAKEAFTPEPINLLPVIPDWPQNQG